MEMIIRRVEDWGNQGYDAHGEARRNELTRIKLRFSSPVGSH